MKKTALSGKSLIVFLSVFQVLSLASTHPGETDSVFFPYRIGLKEDQIDDFQISFSHVEDQRNQMLPAAFPRAL